MEISLRFGLVVPDLVGSRYCITVITVVSSRLPGRKTGSDLGAATALAWSTDVPMEQVQMY